MRVFIAGIDGYLGWPLALYLANKGHTAGGADLFFKKRMGNGNGISISNADKRYG